VAKSLAVRTGAAAVVLMTNNLVRKCKDVKFNFKK
jgi:hypothetical protein